MPCFASLPVWGTVQLINLPRVDCMTFVVGVMQSFILIEVLKRFEVCSRIGHKV